MRVAALWAGIVALFMLIIIATPTNAATRASCDGPAEARGGIPVFLQRCPPPAM